MKVVVAGAGIFGLTAAITLRKRGHEVVVVAPGPIPDPEASSTDVTKMIRADYGTDGFYAGLMERAFPAWRGWNEEFGIELYHETGFLVLTRGELIPGSFEGDSFQTLRARGHQLQRIAATELPRSHPQWAEGISGYFNPVGGWAASGEVVRALAERAKREGVVFQDARARAVASQGGHARGVITDDGLIASDVTLVAAGAWSTQLVPDLAQMITVVGQPILFFRPQDPALFRPPEFLPWAADIANTGWYGFPALSDGRVKIANHGAGRRLDPDAPRYVDETWPDLFRVFLRGWIPALADAPIVGERLCLYSDTWDGDFVIDRHPAITSLAVATGGSGHGFKFGPLLGDLAADAVEGSDNPDLARFRWRRVPERRAEAARAT